MRKGYIKGSALALAMLMVLLQVMPLAAQQPSFTFQILQPQPDQVITSSTLPIAVSFQSPESAPIVRFEAYIGSTMLIYGTIRKPIAVGSFPVEVDLTEVGVKPGAHTLYVKLYDSRGNAVQHQQSILYRPLTMRQIEYNAPQVRITEPRDGDTITGKTRVRVDAVDDSGIQWVKIYINGKMRAMMNQGPFVLPWDPAADESALGSYVLTARAVDLFNNEAASAPVTVRFMNDRQGRTPLEWTPTAETVVDIPGVFPVTLAMLPSGGPSPMRTQVAAPQVALVPALPGLNTVPANMTETRTEVHAAPVGQVMTVRPTKAVPGQTATAQIALMTAAPATATAPLAAMPGSMAPATVRADHPAYLPAVAILAPSMEPVRASRQEVAALPSLTGITGSATKASPRVSAVTAPSAEPSVIRMAAIPAMPREIGASRSFATPTLPQVKAAALAMPEAPTMAAPRVEIVDAPLMAALPTTTGKAQPTRAQMPDAVMDLGIEVHAAYSVKPNETLEQIARAHATTPEALAALNPGITPAAAITPATTLIVPKPDARLYLDNAPLTGGPEPVIVNGYTMVPIRTIVEAKGGMIVWLPKTREVHAWANNTFIGITVGSSEARVNADTYVLPVAASLQDARTMVPLRFMATALELQLAYNTETGTYYLVSKSR